MNKEQKIWLLISTISGMIFMSIMIMAVYDIRFKYGLYIMVLAFVIMFTSFIMYALTQYIPTREIISILAKKVEW